MTVMMCGPQQEALRERHSRSGLSALVNGERRGWLADQPSGVHADTRARLAQGGIITPVSEAVCPSWVLLLLLPLEYVPH